MDLNNFNPWWKTASVSPEFVGKKREIFHEIYKYADKRQILLFSGLRRVGKTTLMYQIIKELLDSGTNPYHILYFSFDEINYSLEEILKQYEIEILKEDISKAKIYLFFDEIQKHKDWPSKIKLLYDLHPNIKIFLTGSAQISMIKGIKESLAGRFFDFVIKPLNFEEYLDFLEFKIDKTRETIYEKELKRHFSFFFNTGGFIETFNMELGMIKKYFKESLIERVVFIDIPQTFKLNLPDLFMKLLNITASNPGFYLDYKSLGNDLKVDQRTIENYISYLEYAMFLQKLYNYSNNLLTSEKKTKRLYLFNTAFTLALNPNVNMPVLLEQFFVNFLDAKFFYRNTQNEEIDIIYINNNNVLPVEIKIREKIESKDVKTMFKFMEKNNLKNGLLIALDEERKFKKADKIIDVLPYWKYWSIKAYLGLS